MCYPCKCEKCGKTTWAGCGMHKDLVMSKVPVEERCTCQREGEPNPEPVQKEIKPEINDLGNLKELSSKEELDQIILEDNLVFVDFYATWCHPCKLMKPIVRFIYNFFR